MTSTAGSRVDWALFLLLGFFWGSSYLFIKIGVDDGMAPFTLVTLRVAIGLALLVTIAAVSRVSLPREPRTWLHLAVIGMLSVALPFTLITWAEQSVDSTLAAVITGAVPLGVIVIAPFLLPDEAITLPRAAGLAIGFLGLMILVGFDPATLGTSGIVPIGALLGATASYAAGGVWARRYLGGVRPLAIAVGEVGFALLYAAPLALLLEGSTGLPGSTDGWFAALWLGCLGSALAFIIFFRLLARWDATRTSLVAYLLPVFGLALGAVVLGERVDAAMIVGTVLIVAGVALVNLRRARAPRRAAGQSEPAVIPGTAEG